jgi:hypothetical protein
MSTSSRATIVFLIAIISWSCLLPKNDASRHPESLKLTIEMAANRVKVNEKVILQFELRNISQKPMKVYARTGRSAYHIGGSEKLLGQMAMVDHPSPNQVVWLQPDKSLEWSEQIMILPVGNGRATLSAGIEIYHPESCDKYGCDAVTISSNRLELEIVE